MKIIVPAQHQEHWPLKDLSDGFPPFDHLETPSRVTELLRGIGRGAKRDVIHVQGHALDAVRELHDHDYVDFLQGVEASLQAREQYIPSVFRPDLSRAPLRARGGMYCQETGTPIGARSISAALNSAAAAIAAAGYTLADGGTSVALCRPPGHHAGRRRYGGYCFFNNAYLAARRACQAGQQAAVVDLDYHLGDGSMEFAVSGAPYYSLHADPFENYPHLDRGADLTRAHTFLRTFSPGTRGTQYLRAVEGLLVELAAVEPHVVVVSMGFDTLGTDYIQDQAIHLEPEDYRRLAETLRARVSAPMVFVLEGGYDVERLADCAEHFLAGLSS